MTLPPDVLMFNGEIIASHMTPREQDVYTVGEWVGWVKRRDSLLKRLEALRYKADYSAHEANRNNYLEAMYEHLAERDAYQTVIDILNEGETK